MQALSLLRTLSVSREESLAAAKHNIDQAWAIRHRTLPSFLLFGKQRVRRVAQGQREQRTQEPFRRDAGQARAQQDSRY